MKPKPIRILQVVGGMNAGGIETWLMHVLRNIDRDRFQIDFLVHTTKPCTYDKEVRALGSQIIPCLNPSVPKLYSRNFQSFIREYEPYDIVHSHLHNYSGYVLRLAKKMSVPMRIAHSHNDTSSLESKAGLHRKLYLALTKWWIAHYKTNGLAASRLAAVSLFGLNWEQDHRCQLLHCGIDLNPFRASIDRVHIRSELGIPADAFVIGHVGRFEEQKNHLFLLEIASAIAQKQINMRLLLVSDGSMRLQIEQKVREMGLDKHVIFTGLRSDVPQLMLGAMDIFVLPSLYEGLGLVLIEAQAAGLPCIFSDIVPEEADVVKPLVQRISLSKPSSAWAETILAARNTKANISQMESLAIVEKSPFNIEISLKKLSEVYEDKFSTDAKEGPVNFSTKRLVEQLASVYAKVIT